MLRLVGGNLNYSSWTVRAWLALQHAGAEFRFHDVGLEVAPDWKQRILDFSGAGKVPVLVDEEEVVYDSTIINEYLEDEYPLPRLMPEDSQGRARIRMLEDYCDNSFIPPTTMLLTQLRKADGERDVQRVEQAREELRRALYYVRDRLSGHEFLAGKEFTLADAAFAPRIMVLGRLGIGVEPEANLTAALFDERRQPVSELRGHVGLSACDLALDFGLQRRTGGEARDLAARDRDPLAGAGVHALARAALGDVEFAEAGEARGQR